MWIFKTDKFIPHALQALPVWSPAAVTWFETFLRTQISIGSNFGTVRRIPLKFCTHIAWFLPLRQKKFEGSKSFFSKISLDPPRNFFFDFFEGLHKNSHPKKFYFPSSKDLEITALQSFHCISIVQMFEVLSFLSLWS